MQDNQENTQPETPEVQPNIVEPSEQQTQNQAASTELQQPVQAAEAAGDLNKGDSDAGAVNARPEEDTALGENGEKRSKKWVVILVVVLIVGIGAVVGGYLVGRKAKLARQQAREERVIPSPIPEERDSLTSIYENLSGSDEVSEIEKDLNATTFQGLDKELSDIDNEFAAED